MWVVASILRSMNAKKSIELESIHIEKAEETVLILI